MKKNDQQRLILNIIIIVIAAFILIFMLLGKFLTSSDAVSILSKNNLEFYSVSAIEIKSEDKDA